MKRKILALSILVLSSCVAPPESSTIQDPPDLQDASSDQDTLRPDMPALSTPDDLDMTQPVDMNDMTTEPVDMPPSDMPTDMPPSDMPTDMPDQDMTTEPVDMPSDSCDMCPEGTACMDGGSSCITTCSAENPCTTAELPTCQDGFCTACTSTSDTMADPNCASATSGEQTFCKDKMQCVECFYNSQCAGTGNPLCVDNVCTGCTNDTECKNSNANFPICYSGDCIQCVNANDCTNQGDRTVCNSDTSLCVECVNDAHCAGKPNDLNVCNTSTNTCVECVANDDCPGIVTCKDDNTCFF